MRVYIQRKFIEESLYGLRCGEEWPGHYIGLRTGSSLRLPLRRSVSILWHCSDPYLILGFIFAAFGGSKFSALQGKAVGLISKVWYRGRPARIHQSHIAHDKI